MKWDINICKEKIVDICMYIILKYFKGKKCKYLYVNDGGGMF